MQVVDWISNDIWFLKKKKKTYFENHYDYDKIVNHLWSDQLTWLFKSNIIFVKLVLISN